MDIKTYSNALKRRHVILPIEERDRLLEQAGSDPVARKRLAESVLPLALKLSREFNARNSLRFSLEDLVQESVLGVFKALDTYKPKHGANFTTWAAICIRTRLFRSFTLYSDRDKRSAILVPLDKPMWNSSSVDGHLGPTPTLEESLASGEESPEEKVLNRDLIQKVAKKLESLKLSSRDRYLLQARAMGEDVVPFSRLAVTCRVTKQAVEQRYAKLLAQLATEFEGFKNAA